MINKSYIKNIGIILKITQNLASKLRYNISSFNMVEIYYLFKKLEFNYFDFCIFNWNITSSTSYILSQMSPKYIF